MSKESDILHAAQEAAKTAESWADLSNSLFDPMTGIVARAFSTPESREAFAKTEEFKKIQALITQAQDKFGLVAGATPKRAVSMLVRLPKSLHAALEREAALEGVALDQLVVTKLSINLHAAMAVH